MRQSILLMENWATDEEQEQLDRRWRPALRSFFRRRISDRHEADDLVQEVLARLCQQAKPRPDSYVFQIAQNLLIDRQRQRIVRERYLEAQAALPHRDMDPIDAHAIAEGRQQLALVSATLAELPERTRTIFILYRLEQIGQDEIGQALGISASAVKQHVAKAMLALSRAMREAR